MQKQESKKKKKKKKKKTLHAQQNSFFLKAIGFLYLQSIKKCYGYV